MRGTWAVGCVPTAGRTFSGAAGHRIRNGSVRSPSISMEPRNLKSGMRCHLTARVPALPRAGRPARNRGALLGWGGWNNRCGHTPAWCLQHTWPSERGSAVPEAQGPHPSSRVHWLTRFLYTHAWVICAAKTPLAPARTPAVLPQREFCDPIHFLGLEGGCALSSTPNPSPEPTECSPSVQAPWEFSDEELSRPFHEPLPEPRCLQGWDCHLRSSTSGSWRRPPVCTY